MYFVGIVFNLYLKRIADTSVITSDDIISAMDIVSNIIANIIA